MTTNTVLVGTIGKTVTETVVTLEVVFANRLPIRLSSLVLVAQVSHRDYHPVSHFHAPYVPPPEHHVRDRDREGYYLYSIFVSRRFFRALKLLFGYTENKYSP
ncbi:hypothetical protein K435DRAFT_862418 [Dendrothele bispora CBS 962.96]|uniref:Uncharacterized protein n=1 Tax=Dendrothele bispora (strain CBS 962.96) TaxID=1314807 RepID=A0A4S8LU47_DENBC|nr:hypothetical protein K435DRAFT_862418 [Dendrothele bispora CBS 962.96]